MPVAVDAEGLVLRIDLRDYGWKHEHHWLELLKKYPFALTVRGDEADRLYQMTYCEVPYLPNGLQGYMLAKATGERIDAGPQTIVKDPNQYGGSYDIQNGISCIGCHKHGMRTFTDTIRIQYEDRSGDIADKVKRIYPKQEDMDVLVKQDQERFLRALEQACGPFLKQGEDAAKDIEKFPEPITTIALKYDRELFLSDVARELGLPDNDADAQSAGIKSTADQLKTVIGISETFRKFELRPLTAGEPITRKQWEQAFAPVARELGIGIPFIVN